MANELQLRRGSSADIAKFVGADGELTVDKDRNGLVLQDGVTPGGIAIPNETEAALVLSDYRAIENFKGRALLLELTAPGIAGSFALDPAEPSVSAGGAADNGGTIKRDGLGRAWKRRYAKGTVNVRWWGVKAVGPAHDDTQGFQAALTYATKNLETIEGGAGHFWFTDTLIKPESFIGCSIRFSGPEYAKLDYSSLTAGKPLFLIVGGSGREVAARIEGAYFAGNGGTIGIEVRGQCGQKFRDCRFGKNALGLLWHNYAKNSFTEWCEAESGCIFDVDCSVAQEYRITSGNESFHGTGIRSYSGNTINQAGDFSTLVGPGCRPYNAPFGPQIWVHKAGSSIIKCLGNDTVFVGTPTLEGFALGVRVGDISAQSFVLVGGIAGITKFTLGACRLALASAKYGPSDGNLAVTAFHPINVNRALTSGRNPINLPVYANALIIAKVRVYGPNYEDRVLLSIDHNGYGNAGSVVKIAQHLQNNGAGLSAMPAYSLEGSGAFIINMPDIKLGTVFADVIWSCTTPLLT
jgi:hypothetical protein